jgi:hypothetical protein
MQLYNAAASLDSPILYPPDIRHARFLPSTKRKLRKLTGTLTFIVRDEMFTSMLQ